MLMPVGPALMLFQKLASMFAVVSSLYCCYTAAMQPSIMQWLNMIKVLSLELITRVNRDSSGGQHMRRWSATHVMIYVSLVQDELEAAKREQEQRQHLCSGV